MRATPWTSSKVFRLQMSSKTLKRLTPHREQFKVFQLKDKSYKSLGVGTLKLQHDEEDPHEVHHPVWDSRPALREGALDQLFRRYSLDRRLYFVAHGGCVCTIFVLTRGSKEATHDSLIIPVNRIIKSNAGQSGDFPGCCGGLDRIASGEERKSMHNTLSLISFRQSQSSCHTRIQCAQRLVEYISLYPFARKSQPVYRVGPIPG